MLPRTFPLSPRLPLSEIRPILLATEALKRLDDSAQRVLPLALQGLLSVGIAPITLPRNVIGPDIFQHIDGPGCLLEALDLPILLSPISPLPAPTSLLNTYSPPFK